MKGSVFIYILVFGSIILSFLGWQFYLYNYYQSPTLPNCNDQNALQCPLGTYCDINSASEYVEGRVVTYSCKPYVHSVLSSLKLPQSK